MFLRPVLSSLFLILAASVLFAQSFSGFVKDQQSRAAIPFANVYFVDLETGTTADINGKFKIEHYPSKNVRVQISAVGYKTLSEGLDLSELNEKVFYLEVSHVDLEEIVVSTHAGRLASENVVSIDRKNLGQLQNTAAASLAEAIAEIPGVEQSTTGAGIGKPVIRGLSGNRIVVYAQGIRVENQQWGGEHGLGVGDVGIEGVEVIKGPASLLYGSDALGGVLYFVSERYAEHNTVQGYIRTRGLSNSLGNVNNLAVKLHKGRLKLNTFATYGSNADYQQPDGERVFNTRFTEKNLKVALGYDLTNWISNIRYSYLQNDFGIPEDTLFSTTNRIPVRPFQTIANHSISWENTLFAKDAKLNLVGGYTGNRRKEFEGFSNGAELDMDLQTYTYSAKWYSPEIGKNFEVIAGAQGMHQSNLNRGEETLIPDGKVGDIGVFSLLVFNKKKLTVQTGLRMDQRQINTLEMQAVADTLASFSKRFSNLNYALGAVHKGKRLTLRANLSSGFRAPNTSELLSHGVHEGTNRFEMGNRDLKSENATQVDFTLDHQMEHLSFQINPFYNAIQNYIFLAPVDSIKDGSPVFEYRQRNAFLYGGEAGVHYHPHSIHWLHFETNISTVLAEDASGTPLPLIPATKLSSTVKLEFEKEANIRLVELYVQHKYVFRQDRASDFETPSVDYNLLNLGFSLEFGTGEHPIEFSAGVKNVLNSKYIDHLSRLKPSGILNQGINFYAGLTIPFEKKIAETPEDE